MVVDSVALCQPADRSPAPAAPRRARRYGARDGAGHADHDRGPRRRRQEHARRVARRRARRARAGGGAAARARRRGALRAHPRARAEPHARARRARGGAAVRGRARAAGARAAAAAARRRRARAARPLRRLLAGLPGRREATRRGADPRDQPLRYRRPGTRPHAAAVPLATGGTRASGSASRRPRQDGARGRGVLRADRRRLPRSRPRGAAADRGARRRAAAGAGSARRARGDRRAAVKRRGARELCLHFPPRMRCWKIDRPRAGILLLGLLAVAGPLARAAPSAADPPPPTVAILVPANGATVEGVVKVEAIARAGAGDQLSSISFYDGVNHIEDFECEGQESCTATVTWEATGLSGQHALTARADTRANLSSTSAPVTVTVLSPPPAVSIAAPTGGA